MILTCPSFAGVGFEQKNLHSGFSADHDRLPIEIWLKILRWATFVPGALERNPSDLFSYPPLSKQEEIQQKIRSSLKTKLVLVLVCKRWRELSSPFLYEALYVGLEQTIERLFKKPNVPSNWNWNHGNGPWKYIYVNQAIMKWTKRIDFAFRNQGHYRYNPWYCRLASLIPQCARNVEIVVVRNRSFDFYGSANMLHALANSSRQLVVYDNPDFAQLTPFHHMYQNAEGLGGENASDTKYWRFVLSNLKHLRSLKVGYREGNNVGHDLSAVSPVSLPFLRSLRIYSCFPIPLDVSTEETESTSTHIPFHLTYEGRDFIFVKEFITRSPGMSSRITTFEWLVSSASNSSEIQTEIQTKLNIIARACPNFENLILDVHTWRTLVNIPSMTLPKGIRRWGLRCQNLDGKRSLMRRLCESITQVAERSESLEVIRFLNLQVTRNLRTNNIVLASQMKSRIDAKGILLEGHDGRPLV